MPMLAFLLPVFLSFFSLHPIHLSVTELGYKPKERRIEIAVKVFIDDLENAIKLESNETLFLGTTKQHKDHKILINNYLKKNLIVSIDKKKEPLSPRLIGFEIENQASVWVYLELTEVPKTKIICIKNTLLFDVFEDQTNLLNLTSLNKKQSFVFKINNHTTTFVLD